MRFLLIYPSWTKLEHQTEFHLPPHGPVVMAAEIPDWVDVTFADENVEDVPLDGEWDLVGISVMLTAMLPRAFALADHFRARGIPVIFGGISAMLHADEMVQHGSLFYGEVEGRLAQVFEDARRGELAPRYDYKDDFPDIAAVGPARRDILNYDNYQQKGVSMVDLFHTSRGCRFNCFPCCTPYLGGRSFRPRPMERVEQELSLIDNDRLFIVDNSLAQDTEWEKELFRTMIPFKKSWCCHPIEDDPEVLDLAAQAGAWYVYQAVFDTSDHIRERIKHYKDHGIGVEGTIILGLDDHDEESIKRLVDFLLEVDLDLAEFTVLTPFRGSRIHTQLQREGRILSEDPALYDAAHVVYQPKQISPERLQAMYHYAWETFYADEPQQLKMYKLYRRYLEKQGKALPRRRRRRLNKKQGTKNTE